MLDLEKKSFVRNKPVKLIG